MEQVFSCKRHMQIIEDEIFLLKEQAVVGKKF